MTDKELNIHLAWLNSLEIFRNLSTKITPENKEQIIKAMDLFISECAKIVEDGA